MRQSNNNTAMLMGDSINQLTYYRNALIAEIQNARIWCSFNKEAVNWPVKKARLQSLEHDLGLLKDKLRELNNQMFKSQIERR